jgi:hypothetical protein
MHMSYAIEDHWLFITSFFVPPASLYSVHKNVLYSYTFY